MVESERTRLPTQSSPPLFLSKDPHVSHEAVHRSFIESDSSPDKKQMLGEKDGMISSHRLLITQLYRHICGLNDSMQRLRQVISALKDSLIKHNIKLPDIQDKAYIQTSTQWNSPTAADIEPEGRGDFLQSFLKSAATIANSQAVGEGERTSPQNAATALLGEEEVGKRPIKTAAVGTRKLRPRRVLMKREDMLRSQRIHGKRLGEARQNKNMSYGDADYFDLSLRPATNFTGTANRIPANSSFASPEHVQKHGLIAKKMRKLLQAGDLLSDILEADMRGEEVQLMARFVTGEAAKEVFKERLRAMMYRMLALFFHLRTYSHGSQKADDHLATIIDILAMILDSERCILYVYDPSSKLLQTKAVRGPKIDCFSVPPERGIIGHVYTSRGGVLLRSPYEDARFDRSIDQQRKSITRNMICVPLKSGTTSCLGCIEVANKRLGGYSEQDYQLLGSAAKEIAAGMKAQSLRHAFEGLTKEAEGFRTRMGEIVGENLLSPLLKNVLIILTDMLKGEKAMLYVKSNTEDAIVLSELSSAGVAMSKAPHELDLKSGCGGLAFSNKEIVFEPFAQSSQTISREETDVAVTGIVVHSIIAVPIFDESGNSSGVLEILNSDKANFSSPSVKPLLMKFAKYVSLLFYTNDLLKNTLESYQVLSISLDNVSDAVMVVDCHGNVTVMNQAAKLMFGLAEEYALGWKVSDILRENERLLEAYYRLLEGRESQQVFNASLAIVKGDRLTINFRCMGVNTSKGRSGDVLLLFQPISKK